MIKPLRQCLAFAGIILSLYHSSVYSQDKPADKRKLIFLSEFSPFKSPPDPAVSEEIFRKFSREFESRGFEVRKASGNSIDDKLQSAKSSEAYFLVDGYYKKTEGKNLNVYVQIYNPETGFVTDALPQFQEYAAFEGSEWDTEELKEFDRKLIESLGHRTAVAVSSNSRKQEKRGNIENSILYSPISELQFPLSKAESGKTLSEVFKYLSEENSISIVTKRVGQSESAEKTSAIVSVITRKNILDSGARNLADILKSVPGVEVFYDQFGFYKVGFRGIRSQSGVLLMMDGHRMNNFYDGSVFLDIRADAIDKVEVIRGPGSSVHGTNALVGVINVITKDLPADKKSHLNVSGRYGSWNTVEPSVFYGTKIGESDWRMTGYAGQYQSERLRQTVPFDDTCYQTPPAGTVFPGLSSCNKTALPLFASPWIKTNDFKRQNNAFMKIQNGKEGFYVSGKMINESRGPNMGELNLVTPESDLSFNLMNGSVGFGKMEITEKLSLSGRIYGDSYFRKNDIEIERTDFLTHPLMSARKKISYNYSTKGAEAVLQYNPFSGLVLMLGVQYEKLAVKNFYMQQNYLSFINTLSRLEPFSWDYDALPKNQNKERRIQGEFVQIIWDPLKWLSFTLGVRQDRYSDFGKTINPKGGIVLIPFEKVAAGTLVVKILGGSAFRSPTFQELYDKTQQFQQGGILGNDQLKPETIRTAEIGADYRTPYAPLGIMLNGYYNRILNNIEGFNQSGVYPGQTDIYANLRGISIFGYEAEIRLNYSARNYGFINGYWTQVLDYGGLPPNIKKDTTTFRLDVPQARLNLGINFEFTKYFVMNHTVWVTSERASNSRYSYESQDSKVFRIPQYYIWNLSLRTTEDLHRNIFFQASIYNMNNYKLYDEINVPTASFYPNRVIPSSWLWGRYFEFKLTYLLD